MCEIGPHSVHCIVLCALDFIADSLENASGSAVAKFVVCDLTDGSQLRSLVSETVDEFGRLDCLINNAGWHPPDTSIDDFTVDDARNLMDLNFFAAFEVGGHRPLSCWSMLSADTTPSSARVSHSLPLFDSVVQAKLTASAEDTRKYHQHVSSSCCSSKNLFCCRLTPLMIVCVCACVCMMGGKRSSLVGYFGQESAVTYAATKGAITAFTKALAIDEYVVVTVNRSQCSTCSRCLCGSSFYQVGPCMRVGVPRTSV